MADCRKCFFYSKEFDEAKQEINDVVIIGENTEDQHFCDAYSPIPDGVFNGPKDCPKFLEEEGPA